MPGIGRKAKGKLYSLDRLPSLIQWLEATGEFEQETIRLNNWRSFLDTLPRAEAERCIESAAGLFDWFQHEADKALGVYTQGVPRFLTAEYARRGCREDQIFCGKEPVEYHLCMVAAEIMNRGLRDDFSHTLRARSSWCPRACAAITRSPARPAPPASTSSARLAAPIAPSIA